MQLKLNNIILHSLAFNTEGELKCYPRNEELANSQPVEELASELHRIYNAKPAKGFGYFKCAEEDNSHLPFEIELRKFIDEESNFVDFSSAASSLLVGELLKYDFVTQGILSFVHYNWMASDYLIVALLENKDSVMVQIINQSEGMTSATTVPANTLKAKPKAIHITSRMTTCLSFRL